MSVNFISKYILKYNLDNNILNNVFLNHHPSQYASVKWYIAVFLIFLVLNIIYYGYLLNRVAQIFTELIQSNM